MASEFPYSFAMSVSDEQTIDKAYLVFGNGGEGRRW
jgi:hypothetical protein